MNHDKEEYIAELKEMVQSILEEYYNSKISIAFVLDELIERGLYKSKRKDVEGQVLGNNTSSDDMIDYIVDRMDLEPQLETIYHRE